ncbi:hypothetical protein GUJ93_ZPchr0020g33579 [Zizania palustris]|uniref:Uncharacterized protein n=1 Tax=Zizania palustris TaxID=103762 RepID=A0A8J5V9F3_ZIZPA|nr:hypothetical protein GUJ93_ZPchr0020g33579 [Zizania palustris]
MPFPPTLRLLHTTPPSSPHNAVVPHRAAVPHHAAVPHRAAIPPSPHHAAVPHLTAVPSSDEPRVCHPPSPRKQLEPAYLDRIVLFLI